MKTCNVCGMELQFDSGEVFGCDCDLDDNEERCECGGVIIWKIDENFVPYGDRMVPMRFMLGKCDSCGLSA